MQRIDNRSLEIEPNEILAFGCVRNESVRLPFVLEYHRGLGVDRFFVVDNASTDDTADYLLKQEDVHVFYTEESYASSHCGIDWLNHLISDFGTDHWILTLDADEMLVYPQCETVNLNQLTRFLDMEGAQAIQTFLVDMYSDKPIKQTDYISGDSFLKHCSYFDSDSYFETNKENIPTRGGARYRLFWKEYERQKPSPYLINVPLIKWRAGLRYKVGTHIISNVRLSELVGAKLHFKFFSDFYAYAKEEAGRNEHWDNAAQYKSYWDVLRRLDNLNAIYEGSVKYESSLQLVNLGLMIQPPEFTEFLDKNA